MNNDNLNLNLPPFYVGQRVVALQTSDNVTDLGHKFIKGNIYTVVKCFKCNCGIWRICAAEVKATINLYTRWHCIPATEPYACGNVKFFAPIQENFQSISLEKVLEEETKLISVN